MAKICWCDVETTGLDCKTQDIIQLAFKIEINRNIVEEGNLFLRPLNESTIDEEALKISNHTKAEVMLFPEARKQYFEFTRILDKYIDKYDKNDKAFFGGYNVYFDYKFLTELSCKLGIKYGIGCYSNHRIQDPLMLIGMLAANGVEFKVKNYKLATMCEYFNIPLNAHDAFSDIEATRTIYYMLINKLSYEGIPLQEISSE